MRIIILLNSLSPEHVYLYRLPPFIPAFHFENELLVYPRCSVISYNLPFHKLRLEPSSWRKKSSYKKGDENKCLEWMEFVREAAPSSRIYELVNLYFTLHDISVAWACILSLTLVFTIIWHAIISRSQVGNPTAITRKLSISDFTF